MDRKKSTPPPSQYLFVGERPSLRAVQIGATWHNARLAGRTLRDVLVAVGIDPDQQSYTNLYTTATPHPLTDLEDERQALTSVVAAAHQGYIIVGMGTIVCGRLAVAGIPHLCLVHPAARGKIRRRDRYVAHARAVLCEGSSPS